MVRLVFILAGACTLVACAGKTQPNAAVAPARVDLAATVGHVEAAKGALKTQRDSLAEADEQITIAKKLNSQLETFFSDKQ